MAFGCPAQVDEVSLRLEADVRSKIQLLSLGLVLVLSALREAANLGKEDSVTRAKLRKLAWSAKHTGLDSPGAGEEREELLNQCRNGRTRARLRERILRKGIRP